MGGLNCATTKNATHASTTGWTQHAGIFLLKQLDIFFTFFFVMNVVFENHSLTLHIQIEIGELISRPKTLIRN